MAAMASPTSPSSILPAHLLLHASMSSSLQGLLCLSPSSDRQLAVVAAAEDRGAAGVRDGERSLQLAAANVLMRDTPRQGGGPHHNAVLPERKVAAGALGQAAPPVTLAAADGPRQGTGPQTNAVPQCKPRGGELRLLTPQVSLPAAAADPSRQGGGPKINAVVEVKPRGRALRRPTPPGGGAGPREGRGGRGGVIHAVADSTPQRPGAPAEGAGGNGGVVHAAAGAASS
ncbi:hypothetical protein E2562_000397 [Oryza meyeriana var. granulata]|uniref:Uncharacterized protein n=1 Tax=Oryza meyeriana var. granulata TaxID=110450 RepID=A0A6G1CBV5_9ORYZ|nr:hypothetical protein E2562_000397 [Oryza meyeriana var. granulata]